MGKVIRTLGLLAMIWLPWTAQAVLNIEITEGVEGETPLAIVPFAWEGKGKPPEDIAAIINNDLARTGRFRLIPEKKFLERPHHGGEVNFDNWRTLGVEDLVVGRIRPAANGRYLVQFQLFDIYRKSGAVGPGSDDAQIKQLAGYNLPASKKDLRRTAHYISDIIFEKLTGIRGSFTTKIAYVTASGSKDNKQYSLQIADSDGHSPFTVLKSPEPLMSPAWSPDGNRMAYVSFEGRRSSIYVQEVATGQRKKVSSHKGINGSPAWSPNSKRLAITLSTNGNSDIYILDVASGRKTRVTNNTAIDTEAVWTKDGSSIIFTSDRSGRPQLYRIPVSGGRAKRLTFEGSYNSRAAFSPDGKTLAMVHSSGSGFQIATMQMDSGELTVLTNGRLDESPTFAPNGTMILYAASYKGKGVLYAISVDGKARTKLLLQDGDVREPAWSPFAP